MATWHGDARGEAPFRKAGGVNFKIRTTHCSALNVSFVYREEALGGWRLQL